MDSEARFQEYIDNAQLAIRFFLSCRQWDGLTRSEVNSWLDNFTNCLPGKYYATKLLSQLIYYSEKDLESMLRDGVFNKVLAQDILKTQISSGFSLTQEILCQMEQAELSQTLFVPLLDTMSPYESGNQITRILVQRIGISEKQVRFANQITSEHESYKRLVIVDDNLGSGDQCRDFWGCAQTHDNTPLSHWCSNKGVTPIYLVLAGYYKSIDHLVHDLPDLTICCVEELQDAQKVFSDNSVYWSDIAEKESALAYFKEHTTEHGINLYGHGHLDFAVILHYTIPDWSLPIFWKGTSDWTILVRRKDSYD